jgi:chromosomal replication initiator protein
MIQERRPDFRICYLAIEDFKNEFIKAHREKRMLDFKHRFQGFDALFIDDIDTLRNSQEATQEEFFHVFNAFYENGKQTVITSDRPAQDLMISSRLMSRFITGLQVQLSAPDQKLRRKFLEFRAKEIGLGLSENILNFLSERVTGNMRVLESALNKLFFLEQRGIEITDPGRIARELDDLLPRVELDHIPLEKILNAICRRFSVSRENILSASRKSEYTRPRHIGMYLGVKYSGLNKSAIARFFHKNDHTTVINAEKNVKNRLKQDPGFALELENLIHELRKDRT